MRRNLVIAIGVITLLASSAGADVLWDNGITPNGFSGRALSPPNFPDIRVVDDFVVPEGETWNIQDFHATVIEDAGWSPGQEVEITIYDQDFLHLVWWSHLTWDRQATGDQYFGRDAYEYWVEDDEGMDLDAGTYWIGLRNPLGSGSGTNYWMTSDGGKDGPGSSTGFFSLDGGENFGPEGDGWHHAFTITGVPEPATFGMFVLGASLIFVRRRRA